MPISGEVLEFNQKLEDTPEIINSDPYGEGWLVRIALKDPKTLHSFMTASIYKKYCLEKLGKGWDV